MAELALQLQVQTQSCHDEIGRIGAELRAILPRCAGDLGRLNVGLVGMADDAGTLLEEHYKSSLGYVDPADADNAAGIAENASDNPGGENEIGEEKDGEILNGGSSDDMENQHVNDENIPPPSDDANNINNPAASSEALPSSSTTTTMTPLETLETLSTLHALQQNLSSTKSILHSVSTYDKTMSTLPSLLTSSSNLNHAVSALCTLEEGARALSGMPGGQKREEEIVQTREKILTLLKPELLHALNKVDSRLGPLQTCVGMYSSLGKIESLMEEYVRNRPSSVHRLWFEFGKKSAGSRRGISGSSRNSNLNSARSNELEFYGNSDAGGRGGGDFDDDSIDGDDNNVDGENTKAESNRASFGEWLPTWYESVLLLLSEEQRRALVVFGPQLAPEIMAKILNECFRPIISSFKARLVAIFPPNTKEGISTAATTTSSSSGSFEIICGAYEATLQFLSVAYESMVDFNLSVSLIDDDKNGTSSSPSRTKTPVELYQMIRSTLITIGSPFAPYQKKFAELEANQSGMTARVVSSNVHGAVTFTKAAGGGLLQSMQDSVEKLTGLAPYIFPLAQAAMTRFESLNSGYSAPNALSTIDTLIARHTGEISIAVHTLSTNMLSNSAKLTDSFDEQQVQYALDVLKIAGLIKRDLSSFEELTRDRLRVLMGRVTAAIDEECNILSAIESSDHGNNVQVPDSLSAAEIEAILAMTVCAEDGDIEGSSKAPTVLILQRLVTPDKVGKKVFLFPESIDSIARLVRSCQSFVFDICSALPMKHLDSMSTLSVWKQEESLWMSSAPDSYGTLPQEHITHVGEHMLALVQALEPFASDKDALLLANLVMGGVEHVALEPWKAFIDAIDCGSDDFTEDFVAELMKGQALKEILSKEESFQCLEDDDDEGDEDDEDSDMHNFCNQWLDAVCTAVTGRLLDRTMRIHHLSRKGCDHLSVDYNYIVNVFTALGVAGHPHPLLSHIAEISKMDLEALQQRISTLDGETQIAKAIANTEAKIAMMRGISL